MYMPAADCPKALKLTFFVALFSQSTLATVTGWLRMIWELFWWGGGGGGWSGLGNEKMVKIVVRDRKTKFSKLDPCIFFLLSILSSRGVFFMY